MNKENISHTLNGTKIYKLSKSQKETKLYCLQFQILDKNTN